MRKLFCIFTVLSVITPALAEGEQQQTVDKTAIAATASYVDGAYNALDTSKQNKLTSTNVVEYGSGAMVTGVTANNGTVTVTKSEITLPVANTNNRATIWLE